MTKFDVNKVYKKMNRCEITIRPDGMGLPLTRNSFAISHFCARHPFGKTKPQ